MNTEEALRRLCLPELPGYQINEVALILAAKLPHEEVVKLAAEALGERARSKRRAEVLRVERKAEVKPERYIFEIDDDIAAGKEVTWEERRRWNESEERRKKQEVIDQQRHDAFQAAMEEFKREVIVEWTTELLEASIALPDGTLVTWGEATAEQHEARKAMLEHNVFANAEAAARHEQALLLLRETGASNLNEAVA